MLSCMALFDTVYLFKLRCTLTWHFHSISISYPLTMPCTQDRKWTWSELKYVRKIINDQLNVSFLPIYLRHIRVTHTCDQPDQSYLIGPMRTTCISPFESLIIDLSSSYFTPSPKEMHPSSQTMTTWLCGLWFYFGHRNGNWKGGDDGHPGL